MNKINKNDFGPAKQHATLTTGEVIKMFPKYELEEIKKAA
jgi:hypothetical protein